MSAPTDNPTRLVDVDGLALRVDVRRGDGTRVPLVLMNGIGARLETFNPLVQSLDPSLEIIRFDAPGIGSSSLPESPYRFRSLARTVSRMLDELGYGTVDVLGISWGGALAQQFAFSERSRCRRVVLVATGTGALMVPGSPRVLSHMVTPRRYRDPEYMLHVAPEIYGGTARSDPDAMRGLLDAFEGGGQRRAYVMQLLAGVGWTSVGFLPWLRQRVLVLAGDDDPIIPTVNARIMSNLLRRGELHIYLGGHIELVANPTLLVPTIEAFLAREGR